MSPNSFFDYATKMYTNETAAIIYKNQFKVKYSTFEDMSTCDYDCRRLIHCASISNDEDATSQCNDNDKLQLIPTDIAQAFSLPGAIDNFIKHDWYESGPAQK